MSIMNKPQAAQGVARTGPGRPAGTITSDRTERLFERLTPAERDKLRKYLQAIRSKINV
ncbi:MAG: hypothetical protein P4N59_03585 [Negativicutes bacterium]|nr:hypothetical protein [Negativicutes bacterium]